MKTETALIALLIAICTALSFLLFARTRFSIKPSEGKLWPLLLYREYILIFLPLILVQEYGIESFPHALFFVRNDSTFFISLISILSIFLYSAAAGITARLTSITTIHNSSVQPNSDDSTLIFATAAITLALLVFTIAISFLGYKHAFIYALTTGENVLTARLENVYSSNLPSQLSQVITIGWWIAAIQSGLLIYRRKLLFGATFLILAFLLSSANGGKAPPLMCITLAILSYAVAARPKMRISRLLIFGPILTALIFFLLFWITALQIPNLDLETYLAFLVNRLGIGQMSGVFETFSIDRLRGDFYLHTIPFASLFLDYPTYDKQLMLFTEGADFSRTGVKNSLFISEAYGIGGWLLASLSPIIVGVSYGVGSYLLHFSMKIFFGPNVAAVYALPIYLLSSPLTGGFSSFIFFKGLILTLLIIFPIFILFHALKLLGNSSRSNPRRLTYNLTP